VSNAPMGMGEKQENQKPLKIKNHKNPPYMS